MQIFLSASEHSGQHKSTSPKENTLVNVGFLRKNSVDAHAFFKTTSELVPWILLIFIEKLVAFVQLIRKRFK